MSGPKYGTAQVDTKRLQALMDGVNALLDDKKIAKVKSDIEAQKAHTEKLIEKFKSGNVYRILKLAEDASPENADLKHLKDILFQFDGFADDEFSYDGNLTDCFVALLNYEEKEGILKTYMKQADETAYKINKALYLGVKTNYEIEHEYHADKKNFAKMKIQDDKVMNEYHSILDKADGKPFYDELKSKLDSVIATKNVDDKYKINRMNLFMKSYFTTDTDETASEEDNLQLAQLKNEYQILCDYMNYPSGEFSEASALKEEIEKLKNEIQNKKSDEYISESLNKVMSDLGYDVVNTEIMSNKIRNVKKNYYDFSDSSVLNISESDDGSVMMEVMGKHTDLSDEEKLAVKTDMDNFCPDYFRIKQELEKYGIYLTNEKLFEADVKYARGINTDNFNFKEKSREKPAYYDDSNLGGKTIGE